MGQKKNVKKLRILQKQLKTSNHRCKNSENTKQNKLKIHTPIFIMVKMLKIKMKKPS